MENERERTCRRNAQWRPQTVEDRRSYGKRDERPPPGRRAAIIPGRPKDHEGGNNHSGQEKAEMRIYARHEIKE